MKTKANVWENSRADQWKPKTQSRFSTGYGGTENIFYFFYNIIIFRLNKEKNVIRSSYVYFNFFHENVNSHNLEIEPTILLTSFPCFITLWNHTQIARNIQIILHNKTTDTACAKQYRFCTSHVTQEHSLKYLIFWQCYSISLKGLLSIPGI